MKGAFRFPMIKVEGGSSPDPAVYCPANGYLPPYEYFESPIEVDVVSNESIVFILDTEQNSVFKNFIVESDISSPKKFSFYDEDNNLLDEQTTSTGTNYTINQTIPSSTSQYVKCILTLTDGSAVFYRIYSSISSGYVFGVVAIYANTPNLASGINFRSHKSLKILQFLSDLDYVTSFDNLLRSTGVERFTMPASMNLLSTMTGALVDSECIQFNFPSGFTAPVFVSMFAFGQTALALEQLVIPSIPSLIQISLLTLNVSTFKQITLTDGSYFDDISQLLEGTSIEVLTLPSMPLVTDVVSACKNMKKLKKATLEGTWGAFSYAMFNGDSALTELHLPRTISNFTVTYENTLQALQTLHVPDYINADASALNSVNYLLKGTAGSVANSLKKVYGDCEFATGENDINFSPTYYKDNLQEVNLPKLRISRISAGTNATSNKFTKLNTLIVDWENSTYSGISPQILIAAPLDSAWLNAMFTALPTVSGKTVDVRGCDGYATCDKTIATAKGWTVL